MSRSPVKGALVFSGGGARGAYQAGVLRGLAEIHDEHPHMNPFRIITGVSAGAINSSCIAASADDLMAAAKKLTDIWANLKPEHVFKAGHISLFANALRILRTLIFSGKGKSGFTGSQLSLLNTAPTRKLFSDNIDFSGIQRSIDNGHLDAFALSATDYSSSVGITFVQGRPELEMWQRTDRFSVRAKIDCEHVMASSALPIFFPAVKVGERYFGDGCLRNTAPLSPAIRLGANKLVIIGVRKGRSHQPDLNTPTAVPGIGKILNTIINSVMMDGIEVDIERMNRINETVARLPEDLVDKTGLNKIDMIYIRPSVDIGMIAKDEVSLLPSGVRYLLSGMGSVEETADIVSYLLFEGNFCRKLIELGYRDCMARKAELLEFFAETNNGG